MGVAVLPARVPVSWLLRKEVAFPPVEQPVLGAGRFALDTALGSCRKRGARVCQRLAPASPEESRSGAPSTCPNLGALQGQGACGTFSGEHLSQGLAGKRLVTE